MMTVILLLLAGVSLAWPWIKAHYHEFKAPDSRHLAAVALLAAAVWSYASQSPAPTPPPPAGFNLTGKFVGPDASQDAALVAAMCAELANELEWDMAQAEPLLVSGMAFDELRIRTRKLLCKGESLGEKHPLARDAIGAYLDANAGTAGGPMDDTTKRKWIAAYREVAKAAESAR